MIHQRKIFPNKCNKQVKNKCTEQRVFATDVIENKTTHLQMAYVQLHMYICWQCTQLNSDVLLCCQYLTVQCNTIHNVRLLRVKQQQKICPARFRICSGRCILFPVYTRDSVHISPYSEWSWYILWCCFTPRTPQCVSTTRPMLLKV